MKEWMKSLNFQCFLTKQPVETLHPGIAATEISVLLFLLLFCLSFLGASLLGVSAGPAHTILSPDVTSL